MLVGYSQLSNSNPVGFESEVVLTPANIQVDEFYVDSSHPDYLQIVFTEKKTSNLRNLWFMYSKKGYLKFSQPILIQEINSSVPSFPTIAANSKQAVALWQEDGSDGTIRLRYSSLELDLLAKNDQEIRFSSVRSMEKGSFMGKIFRGGENFLHIVYHRTSGSKISLFHTRFSNPGTITPFGNILPSPSDANARGNFFPSVHRIGATLMIAWQTRTKDSKTNTFNDEIYHVSSSDEGVRWDSLTRITDNSIPDFSPDLFSIQNKPAVVYALQTDNRWQIKLSLNQNGVWSQPITVSHTNSNAFKPVASFVRDKLRVLWYDFRKGNAAIFLQDVLLQGEINPKNLESQFSAEDTQLSFSAGSNIHPEFFLLGSRPGVIWKRTMQGNEQLILKLSDVDAPKLEVASDNHPSQAPFWSNKTSGRLLWQTPKDTSGIAGYAFLLSNREDDLPMVKTHGPEITFIPYNSLPEGKSWAHVRVIDGAGNFGPVTHYPLWVDLVGPKLIDLKANVPKNAPTSEQNPAFFWTSEDKDSRYKVTLYKGTEKIQEREITASRFAFQVLPPGKYDFWVQAKDAAGNLGNPLRYPFIVFQDQLQPEKPDVGIKNLNGGFFLTGKSKLLVSVKPQLSKAEFSGVLIGFADDQQGFSEMQTYPPDRDLEIDRSSQKGIQWLQVRILYRDGRKSKQAALPFFNGNEVDFMQALDVQDQKKDASIVFSSRYHIGRVPIYWKAYRLENGAKILFQAGTVISGQKFSYKFFPEGKFEISYQMQRPDGVLTPAQEAQFSSEGQYYVATAQPKPDLTEKKNVDHGKPDTFTDKPMPPNSFNLFGWLREALTWNLEGRSITLIFLFSNVLLVITGTFLFLSSRSFRFLLNGLWFKIKWRYRFF